MAVDKKAQFAKRTVTTPRFRVSFPHVFKAVRYDEKDPNSKLEYSITMLFDADTDLDALKAAAKAAKIEKWGKDKDNWPKKLKSPFRDGDEKEDLDGYAGKIFIRAATTNRPGVVNRYLEEITDPAEFYAGCYARANITAFAYETKGNKGVSFALNHVQFLKDGDGFSSRMKLEDAFDNDIENDDDADNDDDDTPRKSKKKKSKKRDDDDDEEDESDDDSDDDDEEDEKPKKKKSKLKDKKKSKKRRDDDDEDDDDDDI